MICYSFSRLISLLFSFCSLRSHGNYFVCFFYSNASMVQQNGLLLRSGLQWPMHITGENNSVLYTMHFQSQYEVRPILRWLSQIHYMTCMIYWCSGGALCHKNVFYFHADTITLSGYLMTFLYGFILIGKLHPINILTTNYLLPISLWWYTWIHTQHCISLYSALFI